VASWTWSSSSSGISRSAGRRRRAARSPWPRRRRALLRHHEIAKGFSSRNCRRPRQAGCSSRNCKRKEKKRSLFQDGEVVVPCRLEEQWTHRWESPGGSEEDLDGLLALVRAPETLRGGRVPVAGHVRTPSRRMKASEPPPGNRGTVRRGPVEAGGAEAEAAAVVFHRGTGVDGRSRYGSVPVGVAWRAGVDTVPARADAWRSCSSNPMIFVAVVIFTISTAHYTNDLISLIKLNSSILLASSVNAAASSLQDRHGRGHALCCPPPSQRVAAVHRL
jgi:hypothetical protein